MRVLYAIQGTGNGHLSRAIALLPELRKRVEVDVLVSGMQADIQFPFDVKYKLKGLSFYFGKNGSINYLKTFSDISIWGTFKEIKNCPVEDYDLVINDFEPITAWACKMKKVDCYSVSHQSALLSPKTPRPNYKDWAFEFILKYYAPCDHEFGFHFKKYDKKHYLPIIRSAFRDRVVTNDGHYTVYLPAYSDKKIIKILLQVPHVNWHVFSKHTVEEYQVNNVSIHFINTENFENSILSCEGVLCGAGFETPSETLFLKKKLLVIPMKGQYEQQSNAVCLKQMGVKVLKKLNKKKISELKKWIKKGKIIDVSYPDNTEKVIEDVLLTYIKVETLRRKLEPVLAAM